MNELLENKYVNIDAADIDEVVACLRGRMLAGTAPIVETYEARLADYFGARHAHAVSSGTAALHLLLYLYDVGPGDEVLVPPTAPVMSALPILAVGATPVFVDTEPDGFGFDLADLDRKLTVKTKMAVTVPMWGYPSDIAPVKSLLSERGVPFVEDASHCHGSRAGGKYIGTLADASFFSTQERKMVATGEGGFILTDDDRVSDRVREIRDFGKPVRDLPARSGSRGTYGEQFGLNFRIAAMSAALGVSQLARLDQKIRLRTENARQILAGIAAISMPYTELSHLGRGTPNYYSLVLRLPGGQARRVGAQLSRRGVVSDTHRFGGRLLPELPVFSPFATRLPNASRMFDEIITVPTHEGLTSEDRRRILEALKDSVSIAEVV